MKVIKFKVASFKGIAETEIHLADEVPGNIITLIGLNESGKTTILEALSHFITEDKETASLVGTVHKKSGLQEIIPKDKKAAFTGPVTIQAVIELDDSDVNSLAEFLLESHELVLERSSVSKIVPVRRTYTFEDSAHIDSNTYWTFSFSTKTKRAKKYNNVTANGSTRPIWLAAISHLSRRIPRIVYFPTFLFNFPDRIYLEGEDDNETNSYYKQVIQDILDSQGENLSVQKHVVDRIQTRRSSFEVSMMFIAYFLGLDEKNQIDAVMQKISNEMSRVIFGAWGDILGRKVTNKRVQVDWFMDADKGNAPYLQVSIIDGQSRYSLSERSLGFRWFFSFLLFTQFRKNRKGDSSTIFLFDEPAANLHSKAQMKLLESFTKIAKNATYIIYSTHSHYMVNPLWLEKAYIVDNAAIDYDDEDQVDSFAIQKTSIRAIKYRTFVGSHPTKTTYFQPVLDALDVGFSPLLRSSSALILEGKFDYHPFVYMRAKQGALELPQIFPANGAGDVAALVNLFRGWGVEFRILLDDDKAGREGQKRYRKDYLIPDGHVVTLGDIDTSLRGKAFESVYQQDVHEAAAKFFDTKNVSKRQFSLFFQECMAGETAKEFPQTQKAFAPIFAWVDETFGARAVAAPTKRGRGPVKPSRTPNPKR